MGPPDRPLYVGNYEYEMPEAEIKRMFEEYGDVERVDMKTGFCFVYMREERDAERAIRKMDNMEVGRRRRPLRVQWAKTKDADRQRDTRPSSTLFVVNFDLARTRERDLERHFDQFGRIKRVEIKKAYAFVQFERVEDAEYALKKTNLTQFDGRTITVEFVQNEDPNAARERGFPSGSGGGGGGGRDYDRERDRDEAPPRRRSRSRERSRSPVRRGRSRSRSRSPRSPRRDRSYSR